MWEELILQSICVLEKFRFKVQMHHKTTQTFESIQKT